MNFRRDRVIVPDTAAAQRGLAKICVRLGFLQEGRLAIERAVHLEDTDVFSWNLLGSLSRQAGELERARVAFTRSLELEPDQPRTKQALEELGAAND
jgi:Flp pilus assembly protein TadD